MLVARTSDRAGVSPGLSEALKRIPSPEKGRVRVGLVSVGCISVQSEIFSQAHTSPTPALPFSGEGELAHQTPLHARRSMQCTDVQESTSGEAGQAAGEVVLKIPSPEKGRLSPSGEMAKPEGGEGGANFGRERIKIRSRKVRRVS